MKLLPFVIGTSFVCLAVSTGTPTCADEHDPQPFGADFPQLDSDAVGEWWKPRPRIPEAARKKQKNPPGELQQPRLLVPRDQVVAFGIYTHDHGVLKLSAQLFPLLPDEPRTVTLDFQRDGQWQQAAEAPVQYPGWSAHFRIENWDAMVTVPYRIRLADQSSFTGTIRRDPVDKNEIVVAALSCNSSRTPGPRPQMIQNLLLQDPDLLFFAGDQSYHHTQHTFGWLEWGLQFREVLRDRPTVAIPDDHDIGQGNLWGAGGRKAQTTAGPDGGYFYPAEYVRMVERCQTWNLPDPVDPVPVDRGIGVYFTSLRVGGIDFAILEDRKFKSGPEGNIPPMGPRPDHINDPAYDRSSVDLKGLTLLGDRQLKFLHDWGQNWQGAQMKCVLSQTAFCGAVHLHGTEDNRLLADLDSNAWPQTGRNKALREIRRAWAPHLCGDQHLAVLVQHGIDAWRDGPFAFTVPAIVNTIYGRWWHPLDEMPGPNAVPNSPLPWTGDYEDGLGNKITMLAYANPADRTDEQQRADGHGLVRFNKSDRTITFECWHRFADATQGDAAQFPGWPVTVRMQDNDGRTPTGWLPSLTIENAPDAVIQVIDESTSEILYTVRTAGPSMNCPVYSSGPFTLRAGRDRPNGFEQRSVIPVSTQGAGQLVVELP